jgi:hypothetical protein
VTSVWDEAKARAGIASIVADSEEAVGDDGVWPLHPLDREPDDPPVFSGVYLGAAGIAWALHQLGTRLDVASIVDAAIRRGPDFPGEDASLFGGEGGMQLVARTLGASYDEERLRALVRANERHPARELLVGSPGTILAARFAGLDDEWRHAAEILVAETDDDGLWTQHLFGKTNRFIGPVHGFAGNVHALRGYLDDGELRSRAERVLRAHVVWDGDTANWPPIEGAEPSRVQWCHGAPGIVATLGDLMPDDLLIAGAQLTWRHGPLEKGPGLCHGTAGNGYALLRVHALTGDGVWLERARGFAMRALEQVEEMRAEYGCGRHSLLTGDIGVALFVRSCLDEDWRFPIMDRV